MPLFSDLIIPKPKRSNSNRSYYMPASHKPLVLYPVLQQFYPAGSDIRIRISNLVRTAPTLAPLFGRYRQDYHIFWCPLSLYHPRLRDNLSMRDFNDGALTPLGDIRLLSIQEQFSESFTGKSTSLGHWLGLGSGDVQIDGTPASKQVSINAARVLNYTSVFLEYYACRQAPAFSYITSGGTYSSGHSLSDWIDFLQQAYNGVIETGATGANVSPVTPKSQLIRWRTIFGDDSRFYIRTLQDDYFTSFLDKSAINSSQNNGAINVTNNKVTFDQIRVSSAITGFLERLIASGGRFTDWLKLTSGVVTSENLNRPEYIGSTSSMIDFELVTSLAASGEAPLGSLAGRGSGSLGGRYHRLRTSQPGYLFIMYSILPEIVYDESRYVDSDAQFLSDLYNPSLDRLSWQTVNASTMFGTYGGFETLGSNDGYGYQPAWTEQITDWNKSQGLMTDSLKYWTLSRSLGRPTNATNFTSNVLYMNPNSLQYIFDSNAQDGFYVVHNFDVRARQPKSKYSLPKTL